MDLLSVRPAEGRGTEHGYFVNPVEGVKCWVEGQKSDDPRKLTGRTSLTENPASRTSRSASRRVNRCSVNGGMSPYAGMCRSPLPDQQSRSSQRRPCGSQKLNQRLCT